MQVTRRTKIIATIGPASSSQEKIESFVENGVNVFRLNFSHGTHEDHTSVVKKIRASEEKYQRPVAILADLQGPKLRVGLFAEGSVLLEDGQPFSLDLTEVLGNNARVSFPHQEVYGCVKPGEKLLLDDGKIRLRVQSVTEAKIETLVEVGGKLSNHKGVSVPDSRLTISALTEKDLTDIAFIQTLDVDYIAQSFVQSSRDIEELKSHLKEPFKIVAKIEKPQALEDIEAILETADAIMVARGDLGVEMDLEHVPLVQKDLVSRARARGLPVIVATQMLESMITEASPTRAEVSDVANAVLDGADAVMLSAESAAGKYPLEAVQMMHRVILATEETPLYKESALQVEDMEMTTCDAIASSAGYLADIIPARVIVCSTVTGSTAQRVSQFRGCSPILALTPSVKTARLLSLVWGVEAVVKKQASSFEALADDIDQTLREKQRVVSGDKVVVTGSNPIGKIGQTRLIQVIDIE